MSNQFPEFSSLRNPLPVHPLELITPKHSEKNDPTLLPGSKKKRLPMSTFAKNVNEAQRKRVAGNKLFAAFKKARAMPDLGPAFDSELFDLGRAQNDWSKLSAKSLKVLMTAGPKSSADWSLFTAQIFMKSQQKIKPDNLNGDWKAGQTLAQMNDQWLLIFGPVIRYLVAVHQAQQPERVFVLGGSTLHDMANWCARFLSGRKYTTNDYTAFDQSQGAEAVHFECAMMEYYGIPRVYIDLYYEQKLKFNHQFGVSAIMRFTGEPGTYKFNTMFSEALMNLQYDLDGAAYMVSGDDSLIQGFARTAATWSKDSRLFKIVAKTEFVAQPIFCGFICSAAGIIREPVHFAVKLAVSVVTGRFEDVAASYAIEYSYGHKLGALVDDILTPAQREAHAAVGAYLFDNSPGFVRAVLSTRFLSAAKAQLYGVSTVAALKGKTLVAAYRDSLKGLTSDSI
jgi:hypothetical protein